MNLLFFGELKAIYSNKNDIFSDASKFSKSKIYTVKNDPRCLADLQEKGYKCCSDNCKVVFESYGFENNEWCACGLEPLPVIGDNSKNICFRDVTDLGYYCYSNECIPLLDGGLLNSWGFENHEWCACFNDSIEVRKDCSSCILDLGFPCCSQDCEVIYSNKCGNWGLFNGFW